MRNKNPNPIHATDEILYTNGHSKPDKHGVMVIEENSPSSASNDFIGPTL